MVYSLGFAALWLAWLLPGHYRPWVSFQQEVAAAAGAGLIVLGAIAAGHAKRFAVPAIAWCAAGVAVVPAIQWQLGLVPFADDALLPAAYLIGAALLIVASRSMSAGRQPAYITGTAITLLGAALASSGIAYAQWLQLETGLWMEAMPAGARVYGNLTQSNHLASLVLLGTLATLWLYETRRIGPWTGWTVWLVFAPVLALTASRTGWLLALLLSAGLLVARTRLHLRLSPPAVAAALLLVILFIVVLPWLNQWLLLAPASATLESRLQGGLRWIHWQTLADAVGRAPWWGYGWYQVSAAQQAAAADHPATGEWLVHSHNLLLDVVIYNGLALGVLFFVGLCAWFGSRLRAVRSLDGAMALAGCAVLLVHALLEYPLHYLYFLMPMALLVGIVEAEHEPTRHAPQLGRLSIGVMLAGLVALAASIAIEYLEVEESWRRVQLKDAGYVTPGMEPTPPDVTLLQGPREIIRFQLTEAREGMSPEELDWMLAVRKRYAQPGAFIRYAVAAGLNGRPDDARQSLVLLCKIWGDVFCDRARKSWPDYQTRHSALQAIAFPVPAAR